MTFKTQLPNDAIDTFLNNNEFAESVTYTPKDGGPTSIRAVIVRNRLDTGSEDTGRALRKECEVYIANDATKGVTSVNKGADTISFPEIIGGSNVTWAVVDIIDADDGIWHLLVGK